MQHSVTEHFGTFTGSGTRTATVNAEHANFLHLEKDGIEVDRSHYTTREGSTVITLTEDHMNAHDNGLHTYRAVFTDGYADLTLTVNVPATPTPTPQPGSTPPPAAPTVAAPQTGDDSNVGLWFALLIAAGAIITAWIMNRQRKIKDNN